MNEKLAKFLESYIADCASEPWARLEIERLVDVSGGYFVLPPDYEAVLNSKVEEP